MTIKVVLFDLDGTLLPMDQDVFLKAYFKGLVTKLAPLGYEPDRLVEAVWTATGAMVNNDGSCTNEEAFWRSFSGCFGQECRKDLPVFEDFYRSEFQNVRNACGFQPGSASLVSELKQRGIPVILATNPLFPAIATFSRIRWAGMKPEDFNLITTYENSRFCKPNPDYYREILRMTEIAPEECLMVGNDVDEDMIARDLGMEVFLLTDCIINKKGKDISRYPHGGFAELRQYLDLILETERKGR